MAERWQQWMPFHIDRFRGSPCVQAMHPCARWGYLSLLASQWQSEDCTISSDELDLASESGLGDELWQTHRARILRKFDAVEIGGRFRNSVCFTEWREAKTVFEHNRQVRSEAGKAGNAKRWGSKSDGYDRKCDLKPSQNIATLTRTVTETDSTSMKKYF